jgi:V8-like Glu-specific endopeptidase
MNNYYYNFNNNYNFDNDTNHFNYYLNENNKEGKKRGYSFKGYNQNIQYDQNKEVRKAQKREYSSTRKIRHKVNKPNKNSNRDIVLELLIDDKRPTFLPEQIMDILRKGTARTEFEDNKNKIFTSFFMKIELKKKQYNFLITCSHSITKEDIASKKIINVYYGKANKEKNIQIILDKSKRFIKVYEDLDVTLIELQKEDNIPDKYYLYPDLNYKNKGYSSYENIQVYTAGFPSVEIYSKTRQMSAGKIIQILDDNEFEHNCDTRNGSSGCPIINYSGNVIGIHFGGERNKEKNYGHFIGGIIERLKKEGIKCLDNEILNHFNMNNLIKPKIL